MQKQIIFFKEGTFSQQNQFVLQQLSREFPQDHVVEKDVWTDILRKSPASMFLALCEASCSYPKSTLGRLQHPRIYATRTRAARRHFSRWKRLLGENVRFTFQTQSIFNASTQKFPHFVYTDHTFLANDRYDDKSFMPEAPGDWVERESQIYKDANHCFTTSHFARESLIGDYGIDPAEVSTVFCGANATGADAPLRKQSESSPKILFVGLEWERKGGPELLEAFQRLRSKIPRAELWIAGVAGVGQGIEGCHALGPVPLARVAELFRSCDLFCLPSRREPSAVVLSEALAYGLPIVATNVGGSPDRVLDGVNGKLVPVGNIARLADALHDLCSNPTLALKMGQESAKLSISSFTWPAVGKKIGEAIRGKLGAG